MQPKFKVGDKVRYTLEDSGLGGLIVQSLRIVESPYRPWYRVFATRNDGRGSIEADERFFEMDL
jgi:hypothetical protein